MYIAGCIWVLMLFVASLGLLGFAKNKEARIIALIVYITSSIFLLYFGIYGLEYK